MLSSIATHPRLFLPWQPVMASGASQVQTATHEPEYIELPEAHSYEELEKHASFAEIQSRFLSDIREMKQLAHFFVNHQYDESIDTFHDRLKSPPEHLKDSLLPLYRETRFQIHRLVKQLKDQQNDPNADSKNYIANLLHGCLNDIELCSAGVHSRFNECFLNLEALRGGLDGKLFEIRNELFHQFIQSFLFEQQMQGLIKLYRDMEVHHFNSLHNLFCEYLGLFPIVDRFAPANLSDSLSERFLSAAPLKINACTILRKLSSDWSDLFSATLQKIGVQAWETEVIDSGALKLERTSQLDSGFFQPVNELLKITGEQSLDLRVMIEETGDGCYHLRRYREKLLGWVVDHFGQSSAKVFTAIGGVDSSLYIGTIDEIFFWVFNHHQRLSKGQAYTFAAENHTTLTLAHLTSIDFVSWSEKTVYALLTQAMEQTNNARHIVSFFLQQATSEQLRKVPAVVLKTLSNQLSDKVIKNDNTFKEKLCQCVCDYVATNQADDNTLKWLLDTPLLKPVLLSLYQQFEMKADICAPDLTSSHISDFSFDEVKMLLDESQCGFLFKQALKLKQVETLSKLMLTGACDEVIGSLSDQQESLLAIFARAGNLPGLKYLWGWKISEINHKDAFGYTPLHQAARYGHAECVKELLRVPGIDVDEKTPEGFTPLNSAASEGHVECVRVLLSVCCIAVNEKNSDGLAPLNSAASKGHVECVKELLRASGIDVNEKTPEGFTSLNSAASKGHAACVKELLGAHGIAVNEKNDYGWTPLKSAASKGHAACVKELLDAHGIAVNEKNDYGWTPLNSAAAGGHVECVKALLRAPGIDVNEKNDSGWTPLNSAASAGHAECVKELLRAPGIDVNEKLPKGSTSLNRAAAGGHVECVKELLRAPGIDVNEKNYYGWTPLNSAASKGHAECVKELLDAHGIAVNEKNSDGWTPLYSAASAGHAECVKELLRAPGIDVSEKNDSGSTPLNRAAAGGHVECVKELLRAPGIDVSEKNDFGSTPLNSAASSRPRRVRQGVTEGPWN